jgi:hypothetical protein
MSLIVYHQNFRGLRRKGNELFSQLYPTFPHVLCLSEHHMNYLELQQILLDSYSLGAGYCRATYKKRRGLYICARKAKVYKHLPCKVL